VSRLLITYYLLPAFPLFVALPQFDDRLLLLFFLSALGREMKTYLTIDDEDVQAYKRHP
jgi:hypothetical protein